MPANPKYLNKNPWHRTAKLLSGLLGGYVITALLHMILAIVFPFHQEALISSIFTFFILWAILLVVPFLFKHGGKALLVYIIMIIILGTVYYLVQPYNPFIHE